MGEQKVKKVSEEEALAEAEKTLQELKKKKVPTELHSVEFRSSDRESSTPSGDPRPGSVGKEKIKREVEKEKEEEKKAPKRSQAEKVKKKKVKQRSQKYKKALELVDRNKLYSLNEALDLVRKTSYSKFEGSVEIHLRLEKAKKRESIRGLIQLPHKVGKEAKAAVLDEDLIKKIVKDKRTDYDILLATPEIMPKIAKIAKILGPQGKMPTPKSGTVTNDPKKSLEEIKSGRIEYKADQGGNIHLSIGKVSWDKSKLKDNFQIIINALASQKLQSIVVSATMGPGIKIAL